VPTQGEQGFALEKAGCGFRLGNAHQFFNLLDFNYGIVNVIDL
jgi:hypothetical protein